MKRFAFLAIPLALAACGDNLKVAGNVDSGVDIDAADIDAQDIDARVIDAMEIDAPPAVVHSGTISVLESKVLNPGTSGTFFGQGVQIGISFTGSDQVPAPLMETMPGSPLGCKAWVYNPAQAAASSLGNDEGPIQVNAPAGSGTAFAPACVYVTGAGYLCPDTASSGVGGTLAPGANPGTSTFTGVTFAGGGGFSAEDVGRYLRLNGTGVTALDTAFPIVAVASASTVVIAGTSVTLTLPGAATFTTLAGVGPTPGVADPGFLADTTTVDFVHTAGGGGHIAAFTASSGVGTVGQDFTMSSADIQRLNAMPTTAPAADMTFTCTGTCTNATASGTLVNIVTTDAPTTGLSPFAMPLPVTERVQVRCAALGAAAVTIPAAYMAMLTRAGITRIQTSVIRPRLMGGADVPPTITSIAGHAIVGFTTINN